MKHQIKIILLLLFMFLITQIIGLIVIDAYSPITAFNPTANNATIPYGMEPPKVDANVSLLNIIVSLAIAVFIFFMLMKFKARSLIKIWFTFVVFITISIALTALLIKTFPEIGLRPDIIAPIIAAPLTFYKIFKRNIIIHNATELLIYPGLGCIFVPILNIWTIIILLVLISIYDMWAVWKSKFMVNLAKFQIQKLKVFTGFFVPYLPKKEAEKLKLAQKIKTQKSKTQALKKIKISLAILGGGDVAFPLIFAGVVYRAAGLIPALIVIAGATIALGLLFIFSQKGKFYPAMPFITAGCLLSWLISLIV